MFLCVYLHFGIFDVYRINQILKYVSLRIFTFWYIWRLENKSNIEICFFAYIYILVYLTSIEWIKYWNMFLCVYLHFGIFDVYRMNQILKYVSLRIFTFWSIFDVYLHFGNYKNESNIEICFFVYIYILVYLTSRE